VYVAPDGSLSYTIAHSASTPSGSVVEGFNRTAPVGDAEFGSLTYGNGFSACPVNGTEWQVYGVAGSLTLATGCLSFDALTGMLNSFLDGSSVTMANEWCSSDQQPWCVGVLELSELEEVKSDGGSGSSG
jgi:hypothetical protein